ncbi:MAG: hypothetical protein H7259_07570, partial [Cytophagales bacterium]|nr:hypothetical protein [Cytophaga sp.]
MKNIFLYSFRVLSVLLFILAYAYSSNAQSGSEWIVPNQSYYKVKTYTDGVYAIPFTQFFSAGLNTTGNSDNLQLWFRGREQSIYVQNDSVFFYGKRNDGSLDSLLYLTPNTQAHKYYNLISDTCAYFFTIGAQAGKRISLNANVAAATDSWYLHEALTVYTSGYFRGPHYSIETTSSNYEMGEGWFGDVISKTNPAAVFKNFIIPISNSVSVSASVQIEIQVVGYSNSIHKTSLWLGSNTAPDDTFNFPTYYNQALSKISVTIPSSRLTGKTQLNCYLRLTGNGATDIIAPAYIKVVYPRSYIAINTPIQKLIVSSNANQARTIVLQNATRPTWIIDNSNPYSQQFISYTFQTNQASFNIPAGTKELLIYNDAVKGISEIKQVSMIQPVINAEYYIVYPTIFSASAEKYSIYRSSQQGGGYSVYKASFEELCDRYAYGEFSPIAIKRFCSELNTTPDKKFMLLLGKGIVPSVGYYSAGKYYYYRTSPNFFFTSKDYKIGLVNLIPTYGGPGSDLMYSINNKFIAQIYTGRVPARTIEEADGYLDKLISHEALDSNQLWRKHLVHLSGGKTTSELADFKSKVDKYKAIAEGQYFGGKVVKSFVKNLQNGAVDDQLKYNIADEV